MNLCKDININLDQDKDYLFRTNDTSRRLKRAGISKAVLSENVKCQLKEYYKDSILNLQKITARDLSHWFQF